jgi:hypothetical protein
MKNPAALQFLTQLKLVRLEPTTISCSKALFVLPIHHLNGTYTQSMSQGLKLNLSPQVIIYDD